ncbi:transposase [Streptomyces sp. NBC_01803]|uniref:transposase n=1 Tax=Streptomyces sp. NBC_01803 TaxID=2975946 RepID=UPI002DD7F6D7|nr:transposase [Streptomyces sp. NBC_01803]WSA45517.1 transposase [Streptomyces sp. NBC_01803]
MRHPRPARGAFGPECTGELPYAAQLLTALDRSTLLLADAAFDAFDFLGEVAATGAQFLVRSSARRCPTVGRRLPDGSYLAQLNGGYRLLPVRVVEAWVTVTLADGTARRVQWRLITSLLDHQRYPARELVDLYHERWQVETTYFSIKATMLDGRVLRSRSLDGIDQEFYALLTVYQALIPSAADIASTRPGLDMDRISFTVLLETAGDQVIVAAGIRPARPVELVGAIGRAALAALWPARRRPRIKARSRKNPTSKHSANVGKHPQVAQSCSFHFEIAILEDGLAPHRRR